MQPSYNNMFYFEATHIYSPTVTSRYFSVLKKPLHHCFCSMWTISSTTHQGGNGVVKQHHGVVSWTIPGMSIMPCIIASVFTTMSEAESLYSSSTPLYYEFIFFTIEEQVPCSQTHFLLHHNDHVYTTLGGYLYNT